MNPRSVDLGSGNVRKLMFSLALPTILSQIVNMLYNLVDRVYIGHMQPVDTVGALALTGVGVCLPVILIISAFAALLAMGGAPRASIFEGRGEPGQSERIMGNSFTLLVCISLVLTVLLQRTPDGTDRRMVHLSITPEGRPLARECQGLQEHCGARLLDGLSPEQVCQLRELLETVLDNGARLAEEAFQ